MRRRFHVAPLPMAELLIMAGLFWSVVCGDVASIVVGNLLFLERPGPRSLCVELDAIRDEQAMHMAARKILGNVRQAEPWMTTPIEGRRDLDELVMDHSNGIGHAMAAGPRIEIDRSPPETSRFRMTTASSIDSGLSVTVMMDAG